MEKNQRHEVPSIYKKFSTLIRIALVHVNQFFFRTYDREYFLKYLADLWMDIGAYHRAIVLCKAAQQISDSPQARATIGWCYLELNEPGLALPYLESAWSKMKDPGLTLSLANCHWRLSNDVEAQKIVDWLEAFPPSHAPQEWFDNFNELKKAMGKARPGSYRKL